MAHPCVHMSISNQVLKEFGFSSVASEIVANANAAIDERQGANIEETKLHAMRGFRPMTMQGGFVVNVMLSKTETIHIVEKRLADAKTEVTNLVYKDGYRTALALLGEALHTVQDAAFHNFEVWPFNGLNDSIKKALIYMLCHGIRDLGHVPTVLNIFAQPVITLLSIPPVLAESVSEKIHHTSYENAHLGGNSQRPSLQMLVAGPACQRRAEDASRVFVKEIETSIKTRTHMGPSLWNAFTKWPEAVFSTQA